MSNPPFSFCTGLCCKTGLYNTAPERSFLTNIFGSGISTGPGSRVLSIGATELNRGLLETWNETVTPDILVNALMASSAIPGVFEMVRAPSLLCRFSLPLPLPVVVVRALIVAGCKYSSKLSLTVCFPLPTATRSGAYVTAPSTTQTAAPRWAWMSSTPLFVAASSATQTKILLLTFF